MLEKKRKLRSELESTMRSFIGKPITESLKEEIHYRVERIILENEFFNFGWRLDFEGDIVQLVGARDVDKFALEYIMSPEPKEENSCPCAHLEEPCRPGCTCASPFSSVGCDYCARYGSLEQREQKAKQIQSAMNYSGPEWIKTSEALPPRDMSAAYSQVQCLAVIENQVRLLYFNHEHECWDDEDGDDYYCDIDRVSHWMPIPESPTKE